jgi:hypothetical protein
MEDCIVRQLEEKVLLVWQLDVAQRCYWLTDFRMLWNANPTWTRFCST